MFAVIVFNPQLLFRPCSLLRSRLNFAALSNDSFTSEIQQRNLTFAAFIPKDHQEVSASLLLKTKRAQKPTLSPQLYKQSIYQSYHLALT